MLLLEERERLAIKTLHQLIEDLGKERGQGNILRPSKIVDLHRVGM
jgi:hypothetical protein